LNERQLKAVMYVKRTEKLTNKDLSRASRNVLNQTATRDLHWLVKEGIFSIHGTGKREIYYTLMSQK